MSHHSAAPITPPPSHSLNLSVFIFMFSSLGYCWVRWCAYYSETFHVCSFLKKVKGFVCVGIACACVFVWGCVGVCLYNQDRDRTHMDWKHTSCCHRVKVLWILERYSTWSLLHWQHFCVFMSISFILAKLSFFQLILYLTSLLFHSGLGWSEAPRGGNTLGRTTDVINTALLTSSVE